MKNLFQLLLLCVVFTLTSCFSNVDQNEEGFLYNSWSGEDETNKIYSGGTYSRGFYDDMYVHTLETQSHTYESAVLSANGLNVQIQLTINWVNNPSTVKDHFNNYGLKGQERFIDPTVLGTIKDVIGKYYPEEIYSTKREQIEADIKNTINFKLEESGLFTLKMVEILDVNLPQSIVEAIERKVKQEQTTLEEEQKAKTKTAEGLSIIETAKAQALSAKYEAEANLSISKSVTPQVLELKRLELEELRLKKWNGKYPNVMSGDASLFLNVK